MAHQNYYFIRFCFILLTIRNIIFINAFNVFNSQYPYFAKRRSSLQFIEPILIDENNLFIIWPMHSSVSGIMHFNSKYYNNLQNEYKPQSFLSSSFQQLFKVPSLKKNQNNKHKLLNRNKRVHGLSLLRTFENKPLKVYANNFKTLNRQKRNLELLRQFGVKSTSLTPVHQNHSFYRQKRLHGLSLLRTFGTKLTYNNLRNNIKKNRERRNMNKLPLLQIPIQSYNYKTDKQIIQKIKRLHNLSLLRNCNNKNICLINNFYNKHQRVRRRTKRVHNLSLLRYDGKLFQNLFAPNVETNLASNTELKNQRFEQKRFSLLLNKLKSKQKNNLSANYLY